MPKEFSRTARISEQLRRELSALIQREVKDPRVGMVTITGIEVSKDLAHARVYFSVLPNEAVKPGDTGAALNHAAGFLRHALAHRLALRAVPALRFIYDETPEHAARIEALLTGTKSAHDVPDGSGS
jgi:ribosome-binding factor A